MKNKTLIHECNCIHCQQKLIQINKLRISNVIDAGAQCQSWIHIDDLVENISMVSPMER